MYAHRAYADQPMFNIATSAWKATSEGLLVSANGDILVTRRDIPGLVCSCVSSSSLLDGGED